MWVYVCMCVLCINMCVCLCMYVRVYVCASMYMLISCVGTCVHSWVMVCLCMEYTALMSPKKGEMASLHGCLQFSNPQYISCYTHIHILTGQTVSHHLEQPTVNHLIHYCHYCVCVCMWHCLPSRYKHFPNPFLTTHCYHIPIVLMAVESLCNPQTELDTIQTHTHTHMDTHMHGYTYTYTQRHMCTHMHTGIDTFMQTTPGH